jgi:site-specific DNA recombinase
VLVDKVEQLVAARLQALDTTYDEARTHLRECLALAGDCHSVYACGSDTSRRMANQAFFTRIYLDTDDQVSTEPTPSYRLLDPAVQQQALTWASLHRKASERPTRTLAFQDEGSSKTHQVGRVGLEPTTGRL